MRAAAAKIGDTAGGVVRRGARADVVVVTADPLVDIANAALVTIVVKRGRVVGPLP